MNLNDRLNFVEEINGEAAPEGVAIDRAAQHEKIRDLVVKTTEHKVEGGSKLVLGLEGGDTVSISVSPIAQKPDLAHDVLLEAGLIAEDTFIGLPYIDVLDYEFPEADFLPENDNSNAS